MPEIRMPKMGDGMTEGTILHWLKKEGDRIEANEAIAEIETDKANVEMPAEESGTLTRILVKEGQTVPVGEPIAVVGEAGDAGVAPASSNGGSPATEQQPASPVESGSPPPLGLEDSPRPTILGEDAASSESASKAEPVGPPAERVKASPLARKTARDLGIDLAIVQGTGPGGQIRQRDILSLQEKARPVAGESSAPAPLAKTAPPSLDGQDVEVSKMRKAIARRTVQSKQTIPHFYVTMPVDMDRAMDILAELNTDVTEAKITVNDLIVKAGALALAKLPDVNVSWTPDDKVRRYDSINIGIAVGTDQGLTVPVIPDCGNKSLRQTSAAAHALIEKARNGKLTPQEMSGGTVSVSNLGMFGVEEFAAIINPPESSILAVGAVAPEVVVAEDGSFVARRRMRITLSCDHRTVDGVLGAKFLQEVKRLLERPLLLLS